MAFSKTSRTRLLLAALMAVLLCHYNRAHARDLSCFAGLTADELKDEVWNFAGRHALNEKIATVELSGNTYFEMLPDGTDFFSIRGDSLSWTGRHIGRRQSLVADSAVFFYDFATASREPVISSYRARGLLDVSTPIEEAATMEFSVVGSGKAVIAPGDTINNVLLTRQVTRAAGESPDSVGAEPGVEIVCYRWYAHGVYTPIAIQRDGELYVAIDYQDLTDDEDSGNDKNELKRIVDSAEVLFGQGHVTVTTTENIELHIYIMDIAGNTYGSVTGRGREFRLRTNDLPAGQFILSIVPVPYAECAKKVLFKK